ncbi:MAG: hypothetical protein GC190_21515 [Alphaproteobacteria bacterium]|nr:hypothetical protein [Alphaproteobacteria bacterium]
MAEISASSMPLFVAECFPQSRLRKRAGLDDLLRSCGCNQQAIRGLDLTRDRDERSRLRDHLGFDL